MSNYKGHITGSIIFSSSVLFIIYLNLAGLRTGLNFEYDFVRYSIFIVISVLFGLWPDIDTNSKGQNIFFRTFFVLNLYLVINQRFILSSILGLLCMLPILGKHRGWTHSLLAMIIVPLPIYLLPYLLDYGHSGLPFYISAVVGFFSHLVLDKHFKII